MDSFSDLVFSNLAHVSAPFVRELLELVLVLLDERQSLRRESVLEFRKRDGLELGHAIRRPFSLDVELGWPHSTITREDHSWVSASRTYRTGRRHITRPGVERLLRAPDGSRTSIPGRRGCHETRVFASCGRRYRHRRGHVDCYGPIIGGAQDRLTAGRHMGTGARRAPGWGAGRGALGRSQQGRSVRASAQVSKRVSRCSPYA